tara:strand:- start:1146 stop:1352 length:207 start_codon:yes stop_codon:yes gene_type:complete
MSEIKYYVEASYPVKLFFKVNFETEQYWYTKNYPDWEIGESGFDIVTIRINEYCVLISEDQMIVESIK